MPWLRNLPKDALVLAASYGDSVGRAEFSRRHVLELEYVHPTNAFGMIKREFVGSAHSGLLSDLKALRERESGQPKHVLCEHEMQGHYMRGMIAHAMSLINHYCTVYQMFTDPNVYSYMWLIHPALRGNESYAVLLEQLDPKLARLPWARTNRSLRGKTEGTRTGLRAEFHEYAQWTGSSLYDRLRGRLDLEWFAGTGIFDVEGIEKLVQMVRGGQRSVRRYGRRPQWTLTWLLSLRRFAERLAELGKHATSERNDQGFFHHALSQVPQEHRNIVWRTFTGNAVVYDAVKRARQFMLKRKALREFPPQA
jgi:asparagine synthase (glutamine-hydrolysing)